MLPAERRSSFLVARGLFNFVQISSAMDRPALRVLVACERSGVVRRAFNAFPGVSAVSCDLFPADDGMSGVHITGDALDLLVPGRWDCVIAHPPCTRLCNFGVRWLAERDLWSDMRDGARFFREMLSAPAPFVAVENPIPHGYAVELIGRYSQVVHPWQYGDGESKATCLWLRGLPPLVPSDIVPGRVPRVHLASPKDRARVRSVTYRGIAAAMAAQWVPYMFANLNAQ